MPKIVWVQKSYIESIFTYPDFLNLKTQSIFSDPKNTLQSESERLQKQQEKEEAEYLRDVEKQTGRTLTIQNNRSRTQKREKSEAVKTRERLSVSLVILSRS